MAGNTGATTGLRSLAWLRLPLAALLALVTVLLPPSPTASAAAPFGNALQLDGVDDFASVADNESLDLGNEVGEDFTIEASVYVPDETSNGNQVIFYKQYAYYLSVTFSSTGDDVLRFGTWPAPFGSANQLFVSQAVSTGWHHIAAVFDNQPGATVDGFYIYFDGNEVASNTSAAALDPGISASTNVLSVGANFGAVPWRGWIDEARLSSSVRYTGSYTVPSAPFGSDAQTRALWHFDDPVCSTSFADSSSHANALAGQNGARTDLFGAPPPSVRFSVAEYAVNEASGSATLTVTRSGDLSAASTVDYATAGGTAETGTDFTAASGTLGYESCQVTQSVSVPITNDGETEAAEAFSVALTSPSIGTVGTPSSATVTIAPSDQQPDGLVSNASASGYIGDNIYNGTGLDQTRTQSARRTQTRTFYVRISNDGNAASTFVVKGSATGAGSKVKYYSGTTDVTTKMRSTAGYAVSLAPGADRLIKVRTTILSGAVIGSKKTAAVSAKWTGDVTRTDVVKAVVKVVR